TRPQQNDLRDMISRRHDKGETITAQQGDNLGTALNRMEANNVSQLPVMDERTLVGLVDESDILEFLRKNSSTAMQALLLKPVKEAMVTTLNTLSTTASIDTLNQVFDAGHVAIIKDDSEFYGLITRLDLINYLRRNQR